MIGKRLRLFLLALSTISLIVSISTIYCDGAVGYVHTISTGFLLSAIFYFLVVDLPDWRRRKILTENFKGQYDQIRISLVDIFLASSSSQEHPSRESLLVKEEFKRYFNGTNENGGNRWDAVANMLQGNEYYLREVVYQLRMLNDEIRFIRSTLPIHDGTLFEFLNRLSQAISRVELTQPEYDEIRSFCYFLWQLFTGYSVIDGYTKSSLIDDMIREVK